MLVTVALIFAALSLFVVAALFACVLGFCAKWADDREDAYLSDELECKYAASPRPGRSYVRSGR
jgi:hypothetical protein